MDKLYASNRNGIEWAVTEENAPVFRMAMMTPITIEYIVDSVNNYATLRAENERLRDSFVNFVDYVLEVGEFALPGKSRHPLMVAARKHKKDLLRGNDG